MKNQYFGDINDYRKYGFLRALLANNSLRLHVAWMMTPDDGGNDGANRGYLQSPEQWRHFDAELYDGLRTLLNDESSPCISLIEGTHLLTRSTFHQESVPDTESERSTWFGKLMKAVSKSKPDIVFLDPDNGIEIPSRPVGQLGSSKYVTWAEIQGVWDAGCSVLIYQHFPREQKEKFTERMISELIRRTGVTFARAFTTPRVLFLFAAQVRHEDVLRNSIANQLPRWTGEIDEVSIPELDLRCSIQHPLEIAADQESAFIVGIANLFWGTRKLTQSYEDHLTEFVAALISSDEDFRYQFEEHVLANHAAKAGWQRPTISGIETQVQYPGANCCPDMRLVLDDGHVVICEHKVEAGETIGSEADPREQLRRYLDLPIDGLVYIRASCKPPHDDVLSHPKYILPPHSEREHFLWADLYPWLEQSDTALGQWIRDAFKKLGYTPAHPALGNLIPGSPDFEKERQNFFKLVEPMLTFFKGLGWSPVKGPVVDVWLQNSPVRSLHTVRLDVSRNLLNVKIVPSSDPQFDGLKSSLRVAVDRDTVHPELVEDTCQLSDRKARALTVTVPVPGLLTNLESVESVQEAIMTFVSRYVAVASCE